MNSYLIIPFFSFCVQLIAIVYGLVLRRRGRLFPAFAMYSLLFAGWALTDMVLWLPIPETSVIALLKMQMPFYVFTGATFLYLVYCYLHRQWDYLLTFFFAFNVLALLVSVDSELVVAGYHLFPWGYSLIPGPLHLPGALVGALVPYLIGAFLLSNRVLVSKDAKEKRELGFYVGSIYLLILITFMTFILLPKVFGISSLPMVHSLVALFQLLNLYAIFRYQLFSIGIESAANELFADATDGIIILGNDNRIVQANQRAQNIIAEGFPESLEITVQALLDRHVNDKTNRAEIEVEVERDNGERGTLLLTLSPVTREGEPTGKLLQVRDITEQRRAQQHILDINTRLALARDEALSSSQAKSRFLANMSHELRTPLNAIIGYSEMLKEQLESEGSKEHADDIDRIHLAGNHLLSVINNILDLSKIEAGKVEVHIDSFTVGGLARMVSTMAEPSIRKNGNKFVLDCPDNVGDMRSDVMKLRQSLINILSNAGRFTKNGKVELVIRREPTIEGDQVAFKVIDNGIGIKPENLERIFETFSQADDETTRVYGGSGLGLAISKRLVEILGGSISVESEYGKGSTFTIRVPAEMPGVPPPA